MEYDKSHRDRSALPDELGAAIHRIRKKARNSKTLDLGVSRKRAWASETGVFNSNFQDATLSLGITRAAAGGGGD